MKTIEPVMGIMMDLISIRIEICLGNSWDSFLVAQISLIPTFYEPPIRKQYPQTSHPFTKIIILLANFALYEWPLAFNSIIKPSLNFSIADLSL